MFKRVTIWFLSIAALAPASLGASAILAGDDDDRPARPNIVLIVTDDQRWDTLSQMPGVDRLLADRGLTFSNAFVTNPLCCPSRSAILTGTHSHSTGVYTNEGAHGLAAFDDRSTIATWLDDAGYETAFIGKYFNGSWPAAYVPPGWDRWAAFRNGDDLYYDYDLLVDGRPRAYGTGADSYSTDVLARYAERFIRMTPDDDPLFMMVSTFAPHSPRTPPPGSVAGTDADAATASAWQPGPNLPETDVSDKPAYVQALDPFGPQHLRRARRAWAEQVAALRSVDEMVTGVVRALRETGRLTDTLIVFTSDNGIAVGEHGWTYKLAPYEESIRVPLVMRYDPLTDGGRTDALAVNVDIAPTIAALAGVRAPGIEGRSMLPILEGEAAGVRKDFLIEHVRYRGDRGLPDPPTYCAVRTHDRLFVHYATGEEELYDLDRDPWELENLATVARRREELTALRQRTKQLCRPKPPGFTWR